MSRRRKFHSSPKTVSHPSYDGSVEIVLIDREPILEEWRKRCAEIEKSLREIAAELESFHSEAAPAYSVWLSSHFGAELTAVRELTDQLYEAEVVAAAVRAEIEVRDVPDWKAFETVMARKKTGEDLFPESFFADEEDWEEGWSEVDPFKDYSGDDSAQGSEADRQSTDDEQHREKVESEARRENERRERDFLRKERKQKDQEQTDQAHFSFVESTRSAPAKDSAEIRLKALYRRLAFLLHPDANPTLTERERQIWNQVQAAYQKGDANGLELLLVRIESANSDWLDKVEHVSVLQAVWESKRKEFRIARSEINRLQRDSAWKFWSTRNSESARSRLNEETESALVKELLRLEAKLRVLQARFARLSGQRNTSRHRR
ncbi:MAG: J domain-containing protein [Cryobacterium sp.]|nr:J domain-containing protein [Oligoflexia bacterium]